MAKYSMIVCFCPNGNKYADRNVFVQLIMLFYDIWFSKERTKMKKKKKHVNYETSEVYFLNFVEAKLHRHSLMHLNAEVFGVLCKNVSFKLVLVFTFEKKKKNNAGSFL